MTLQVAARRGTVHRSIVALIAMTLMLGVLVFPGSNIANANGPTPANGPVPLSITTTPSSNPVASGDWLTWTITVVNDEPDTHTVRITDQINGMRDLILTSNRGYCTESNLLVTCDGVRLPGHGATWVVTVRGLVTAPDGDTLFNTATVVARNGGQDFSVQDTSSVLVSNQPSGPHPDLSVSIDAPLTAPTDSNVTYTLTVNNSGAVNANDINVTAHVPGGYTPLSTTETSLFDCTIAAPAIECTGGRVNAGSNAVITILAKTAPTASPPSYMAKAVVDPYDEILENDELNNTAEREMTLPSAPAPTEPFVVTKVGSPAGQVRVGDVLTYTINIANTSTKWRAERIKITDGVTGLNAATISASSSHPKALCNLSAQTSVVFCNASNNNLVLNAGQSMLVTITGTVVAEPSTVLRNTVTVEAIQNKVALTRTSSVATTVRPKVDLTLTQKTVCDSLPVAGAQPPTPVWGNCPVRARDQFNYVITVGNSGLDDATNVRVREPLPDDVVFEGFSATGGFNCITPAVGSLGGVVDCRNGSIAGEITGANLGGTVQTIVLHLTAPNSTGPITATATIDPANAIFEADETNNTSTNTTPVRTGIDLTTQQQVNHPSVAPSGTLVYNVIIQNVGTQDSTAITLDDIFPEGARFRAAKEIPNPVGFDYTPEHGWSCTESGGEVTCTGGRLKGTYAINGGPPWAFPAIVDTTTIEITLFAPAATSQAYAFDMILNQARTDPGDTISEIDEDPIVSNQVNNLNLLVSEVQIPATPGTNGTFHEFSITNEQTNPAGTSVAPNGTLEYTLTVTNHGSDAAFNISLTDTVPAGSRFRAANASALSGGNGGFICTYNAGVVECNNGTLAPGGSATIGIKLFAPDTPTDATSNYTNHAVVDPYNAIPEADETNNVADVLTVVEVDGANEYNDLEITNLQAVPVSGGAVAPSGTLKYNLTVSNTGRDLAQNIVVRNYLPEGAVYRSAKENDTLSTDGGGGFVCFRQTGDERVVECSNGTLLSGEAAVIEIVMFAPTQPGEIHNQAAVDPANAIPEGNEGNNTAVSDADSDPLNGDQPTMVDLTGSSDFIELDITELTGTPASVTTDTPVEYSLKVANVGSDQAFNIVVEDYLAPGMTFISAEDTVPGAAAFTCSEAGGTVTCTGGSIPAGGDRTIKIIARSPSHSNVNLVNNATEIENQALVDPNNAIPEGDETNNSAFVRTTVLANLDLSVGNDGSGCDGQSGNECTWTFEVTNNGPDPVTGVVVVTDLPVGVIPLDVVAPNDQWSCQITENPINQVTCTRQSSFAAGTDGPFNIRVYVTANSGNSITSTTFVDPDDSIVENNEDNNTASSPKSA